MLRQFPGASLGPKEQTDFICTGSDQGVRYGAADAAQQRQRYQFPPLWGPDSFNDGAGMARLIAAANFIHFNMPHGTDYLDPQLSPEQAWDVAAYMVSQPRPQKAGLDKDFPNLLEKPVDVPYGPYADGFSAQQHKYGPFAPIREGIARMKAASPRSRAPAR